MASSKTLDESLWWDSFVSLFEELDATDLSSDLPDALVKKVKGNRGWFLDSVSRFKSPNQVSKIALDSTEILIGSHKLVVKQDLKEAAFRVSSHLDNNKLVNTEAKLFGAFKSLDEVQSYMLVSRLHELNERAADIESDDFLHMVLIQYYYERQCLLKCIRRIFVHALCVSNGSCSSDAIVIEAIQLIHDGLERKLLSILIDLMSSAASEKSEVDLTIFWVEESAIEDNLILDALFLVYYDNFCSCSCEQWKRLCSVFKDMLCGSFCTGKFSVSFQAKASFDHAKSQLLLILIETLNLENLLQMVHDEVPFRQGCSVFSLSDVQEMDVLVSSVFVFGTKEAGPLVLAWAVFVCLLSSLPERTEYTSLMEIDHIEYLRQAFEVASFNYLLEILRSDLFRASDGPISGYLSVLRTVISAFIASYELNNQTAENTINLILDILSEIYHGEDSLCMQFWDRDSFVDEPIRSLLYMLESKYPFRIGELVHLLSSLCSGMWSAECVYNFLEKMGGVTMLSEIPCVSQVADTCDMIISRNQLDIPSVEGVVIPRGTRGQILKVFDSKSALVRWEFAHSGFFLLVMRLTQKSNSCSYEEVSDILNLLDRMVSSNLALCFRLLCFEKSVPVAAVQNNGTTEMNVRVDLVKIICILAFNLVQDVNNSHIVSICVHILSEFLKCAPCHVTDVVSRSNIFGPPIFDSSGPWLLSGGLARMLLANGEENGDCSQLAISVLDFTLQLVENGGHDSLSSTIVVFSLQYVLVNHMHWKYKQRSARWKVTLKVLEVMKSCVTTIQDSHKLGSMIRDILFFDSSIHNVLCQILCISPSELEISNISRHYELKDIEGLQLAVRSALDIVYTLLADFLKFQETFSSAPSFIQAMLSSTAKPIPIVRAVVTWINFFSNSAIQVAAAKVFSKLVVVASKVQPYRIDNVGLVFSSTEIKELNSTIFRILDELNTNEDLLTTIFDLLTSTTRYQPTFLVSLMLPEEDLKVTATTSSNTKCVVDLILKYVTRSENLIKRGPRVLLTVLKLLKALWEGGILYLDILEKIRSSGMFWERLASILAIEVKVENSAESLNVPDLQCTAYRCLCQSTILEILAHELFFLENLTRKEISEKVNNTVFLKEHGENRSAAISKSSDVGNSTDKLSTCFESSTMVNLLKSYASSEYNKDIILHAKIAVCMCIVHLIDTLSTGNTGSLSISLVEKITIISQKLSTHPAFSALLGQYLSHGYSEGKELTHLLLNDLYYHIQGELEGRQVTQGPFQELVQFLREFETFQCNIGTYEGDELPPGYIVSMFDTNQVRAELGLELWEYSGWKASIEVAERMLLHMQDANRMISLSVSKYSALNALVVIISMHNRNAVREKLRVFDNVISMTFIESNVRYVCDCLQATADALVPALNPPEILLQVLASQAELLLVLSIILLRQNLETTNRRKYVPLYLLLIKTSSSGIKFVADIRSSTAIHNKAVKLLLTLFLTSIRFIYYEAYVEDKSDLDGQFAEASRICIGLLPTLCKYVEHAELSNLSVASIDLMLKASPSPNTWLPIIETHLQLQHIVQRIHQIDDPFCVQIILNFLLTLARTKHGAQMLYAGSIFSALKVLFNYPQNDNYFFGESNRSNVSTISNDGEKPVQLWGLCLAIISSMIHSFGDDPSFVHILDSTCCYFFSEKYYIISFSLRVPSYPFDDHGKKRVRDQKTGTSLTALRLTEHSLTLVYLLARHQASWSRGMKQVETELRETCIHLLAFISKGMQRIGDLPNKSVPVFCPPTLKEEIELNERPSFAGSKHGWFSICALGLSAKTIPSVSNKEMTVVNNDQAHGNSGLVNQTHFSDTVAIQMYRIAFLLLSVLCMQAKAAAKRAEELEFIDLAYFPELPMPEILHGLQDQSISIVTEVCEAHRLKSMQAETEGLCLLLLQILEKSLYLELCVSQSCGIRPVLGRIEDFSKEIKALTQVVERHSQFKASLRSLSRIIALVYPGLLRSGGLI